VSADGGIARAAPPVRIVEGAPLWSVALQGDVAWVSGAGLGLAAVDVSTPSAPRTLGEPAGETGAGQLAWTAEGILAVTAEGSARVLLYAVDGSGKPEAPEDVTAVVAPGGGDVHALVAREGRAGIDAAEVVVAAGRNDGTPFVHLLGLEGSLSSEQVVAIDAVGLHLDEGALLYATSGGDVGAVLRRPDAAGLREGTQSVVPLSGAASFGAFFGTTVEGSARAVVGRGRMLHVVELSCE